jgi:serine phosphatase RsbU (regulator of sigma subunit)
VSLSSTFIAKFLTLKDTEDSQSPSASLTRTALQNEPSEGQIIAISTDGIWETENSQSEKFGKFRLRQIIRQHSQFSAQEILNAIINETH